MKVAVSWSGGKDSCVVLHELRSSANIEIAALLTTVSSADGRIKMHGVPASLLRLQAKAVGVHLVEAPIREKSSNAEYEAALGRVLARLSADGVEAVAYGDLFLADIRAYRDELMAKNGMEALYPLWGSDSLEFIRRFISNGFRAITCCVDLDVLPAHFAGRLIDESFLVDLPAGVDPCGENGEFHSFVFDGPGFSRPVPITIGERRSDGRFCFCNLDALHYPHHRFTGAES